MMSSGAGEGVGCGRHGLLGERGGGVPRAAPPTPGTGAGQQARTRGVVGLAQQSPKPQSGTPSPAANGGTIPA